MKRRNTAARVLALALVMLLLAGLLLPAGPAPAARAQAPAIVPFLAVTVADAGPAMSSRPFFAALAVNGDWIGYTISNLGCGHCGTYVHTMVLRDTVHAQQFTIHAATYRDFYANDVVFGARDIQFAGPY